MATETPAGTKLVQYLTEAHGKEKELEVALAAHVEMATRPAYKKRLRQHLKETKQHAKLVERRLKKLGGGGVADTVVGLASRGVATAKGPLHSLRGTGPEEKQLKNAKTEYSEEHEEIATYTAIEALAEAVGDKDTAKLARQIRREEERMASFLEKQIPILTREVVKAEVPAQQRRAPSRSRRKSGTSAKSSSKPRAKRSGAASSNRKRAGAKSSSGRKRRGSSSSSSGRSRSRG